MIRYNIGEKRPIARNLDGIGKVDRAEGQPERAARLFGAADAFRQALNTLVAPDYRSEYEHEISLLRVALSEEAFEKAWTIGHTLTLQQAVALALGPGAI
jgi:hypothetical protein